MERAAYVVPAGATFAQFTQPERPRERRVAVRAALYALQAIDAVQTAIALRHERRYEQNRMLRPFAHGGLPTLLFGFAIGDVVRDAATRRAPQPVRDGADGAQALSNLDGILNTRRAMRAP